MNKRSCGYEGELKAAEYLLERGYRIITRNWNISLGEIDLVALYRGVLVFVEVRSLSSDRFGTAEWKLTPAKIEQVARLAQIYRKEQDLLSTPFRIDAIAITNSDINHYKNVFFC